MDSVSQQQDGGMRLVVLTPYRKLIDVMGVREATFMTSAGLISVLPGHAPMVTAVETCVLIYTQNEVSGFLQLGGGLAEVTENSLSLFVETAEDVSQIDVERARRALERAESWLAAKELSHVDIKRAEAARARAQARLEAASLHSQLQRKESEPSFGKTN